MKDPHVETFLNLNDWLEKEANYIASRILLVYNKNTKGEKEKESIGSFSLNFIVFEIAFEKKERNINREMDLNEEEEEQIVFSDGIFTLNRRLPIVVWSLIAYREVIEKRIMCIFVELFVESKVFIRDRNDIIDDVEITQGSSIFINEEIYMIL